MIRQALVFDLDGTLVDTAPDLMRATNHVLATLGRRPISLEEVRSFVGHGARALIARGCAATGDPVDPRAVETLYQEFVIYYAGHIAVDSKPFDGLVPFLDRCRGEGIALGVCTNKLESLSHKLLGALELDHYFSAVVGPDTIGIAKPDPRPYQETLKRMDASASRSIMIGDSETDILTARAAGVPVIAVPFGYTPRPVGEYGPDRLVSHYDGMWQTVQDCLNS
ncbi:MAG: phosphoglycolate phosphatase [Aestuariivirga sp.]